MTTDTRRHRVLALLLTVRPVREVAMRAHDDEAAVIQTLRDYYAASSKHDTQSMLSYYHESVMLITPRGVISRATHTDAMPALTELIARLGAMGADNCGTSYKRSGV